MWILCSVVFHALTLRLPIQTSLSVAPKLPVSFSSHEKCPNFRKTSTIPETFFVDPMYILIQNWCRARKVLYYWTNLSHNMHLCTVSENVNKGGVKPNENKPTNTYRNK